MATKNLNLGRVPVSRGDFNLATTYYKDNIVQYQDSSYQVTAESITGVTPINTEGIINTGWSIFSGSLYAYRWKTTDTPASDGKTKGNLKDLYQNILNLEQEQIQGGIYDVSAHNNGAVFESLSTLLNHDDLSTLIPTSVRCGGMSIRFIQSVPNSDNKYVQFRLMSDSFNTTVANWQGVDDEPTAGSDNLVKSGGVLSCVNDKTTYTKFNIRKNFTINPGNGNYVDDNNSDLAWGFIKEGKEYVVYNGLEPVYKLRIAFYDTWDYSKMNGWDGTFISSGYVETTDSFLAPENAKGMMLSPYGRHFSSNSIIVCEKGGYMHKLMENILQLQKIDSTLNGYIISAAKIYDDTIINGANGYVIDNYPEWTTLEFNNLKANTSFYLLLNDILDKNTNYRYAIYNDFAGTFISGDNINPADSKITLPSDTTLSYRILIAIKSSAISTSLKLIQDGSSAYLLYNMLSADIIGIGTVFMSDKQTGKYVNGNNGLVGDSTYHCCYYFIVQGGKKYRLKFDNTTPYINDYWRYNYAIYTNSNYSGYVSGKNPIDSAEIEIPSSQDTYYLIVSVGRESFDKNLSLDGISDALSDEYRETKANVDNFLKPFSRTNYVVWIGTSIPEGAHYPNVSCRINGLECINKSLGSSALCFSNQHPATVSYYSGRSLTATVAELEALYRQDVTDGVITEAQLNEWKNYSYERSILPYIDGSALYQASMIVIDHGYNDRSVIESEYPNIENWDWNSIDRTSFHGAFRYLLNKIQEINPFVKIVIGGYFTNTVYGWRDVVTNQKNKILGKVITEEQTAIAKHYNISILKVWEHTQISNYYVAGTANYISDFNTTYGKSYNKLVLIDENQQDIVDANGNIPSLQIYCPDGIHPHTDSTGNCNKRLNAVYAKLLRRMI